MVQGKALGMRLWCSFFTHWERFGLDPLVDGKAERLRFRLLIGGGIHADVIVYIFAHLHRALRRGNMLDMN